MFKTYFILLLSVCVCAFFSLSFSSLILSGRFLFVCLPQSSEKERNVHCQFSDLIFRSLHKARSLHKIYVRRFFFVVVVAVLFIAPRFVSVIAFCSDSMSKKLMKSQSMRV